MNEVSISVGDPKVSISLPSFLIESESLDQTETDLNEVCGPLQYQIVVFDESGTELTDETFVSTIPGKAEFQLQAVSDDQIGVYAIQILSVYSSVQPELKEKLSLTINLSILAYEDTESDQEEKTEDEDEEEDVTSENTFESNLGQKAESSKQFSPPIVEGPEIRTHASVEIDSISRLALVQLSYNETVITWDP